MPISPEERDVIAALIFGQERARRFTQDSPVLPDVWMKFYEEPGERHTILLSPEWSARPGAVSVELTRRLEKDRHLRNEGWRVAYNVSTIKADLRFEELLRVVLPMTKWWAKNIHVESDSGSVEPTPTDPESTTGTKQGPRKARIETLHSLRKEIAAALIDPNEGAKDLDVSAAILWMVRVAGAIALSRQIGEPLAHIPVDADDWLPLVDALADGLKGFDNAPPPQEAVVWSVTLNREANLSVAESSVAVKADAARRLFEVKCNHLAWAIVDSGIDARHAAFKSDKIRKGEDFGSRVEATYDFTIVDDLLAASPVTPPEIPEFLRKRLLGDRPGVEEEETLRSQVKALHEHMKKGRDLDWSLIEPLMRIPHRDGPYEPPPHDHGTHVAGILGAHWLEDDELHMEGICPDIRLYDLRVLDADGRSDEFSVIAALQFIRFLNGRHDAMIVHGVNISLSIKHDVSNYACGRTPICEECERLVKGGLVVVAAAGNRGYQHIHTAEGPREIYNSITITDPGNTEAVITVGATHRNRPHTYGVSYFSSRGPTGDGRCKPDLVAPGEKIIGPVPGGERSKDGTSMAAPHVSGAAALLMARHNELIGQPDRIKKILMGTATDLGRERYFQGAGMLDILRALQSL